MRSRSILSFGVRLLFFSGTLESSFKEFVQSFCSGYNRLDAPEFTFDYREYFESIPDEGNLLRQGRFFDSCRENFKTYKRSELRPEEKILYDHLLYEISLNRQRIALESGWVRSGRKIPLNGLHALENYQEWYSYFILKTIGSEISPEEIMQTGLAEVERVKKQIDSLRISLGFRNEDSFYLCLQHDSFYYTDRPEILTAFQLTDSVIRSNLPTFTGVPDIPPIYAMEWPGAGPFTPPGIYLNRENNAYGKDVFQYNFYGKRYNRRAIEWVFMHEALPGHHLQFCLRKQYGTDSLQELFIYPGNFEGWACYVEYHGKRLGLYSDPWSELGKWEWDLVRSARLVIECGIHYYGWSAEKALAYWKENIKGQDRIAEREITRVSNWPGQALSYKIGALAIMRVKEKMRREYGEHFDEVRFHQCFLKTGNRPLSVSLIHLPGLYKEG